MESEKRILDREIVGKLEKGLNENGLSGAVIIKKSGEMRNVKGETKRTENFAKRVKGYIEKKGYSSEIEEGSEEYHIVYWRTN